MKKITITNIVIRFVLFVIIMLTILLWPAGTINWWEAYVYMGIYTGYGVFQTAWLAKNDPTLLKERSKFMKGSAKGWDKVLIISTVPLFLAMMIIPGFDAVRYGWSSIPLWVEIISFVAILASLILIFFVMKENTYLSRTVEVLKDRGHKVITTGPYSFVRHPMYLGVIILFIATPLSLGSLHGLIPSGILAVAVIIRAYFEDKMLQKELEGYKDYTKKTQYRLFPGIW